VRQQAAHPVWQAEEIRLYGRVITCWDEQEIPREAPAATPAPDQLDLFAS
jgi:hypothetical protein